MGYPEMRAAVLRYADEHAGMDPLDIHWVLPRKLLKEMPEVSSMRGSEKDIILMVRAELVAWWRRQHGCFPPTPAEDRPPH